MTDDQLRELYGRTLARRDSLPGNGSAQCVTPEKLLGMIRREGTEEERLQTLDHVMACQACRRELDLLRAIETAGVETGPVASTGGRLGWPRSAPLALAASLLLALGIVLGVRYSGDSADVPRGDAAAVVLLTPPELVARDQPIAFAWRPVPKAHQYVFEFLDTDSGNETTAFSRKTSDTSLVLQPGHLRRGREYQWWVRALTPAGELASPMRTLRVRSQ